MQTPQKYWFPAKRYGWGWGPPATWQGWVVMLIFFVLLFTGMAWLIPRYGNIIFIAYAIALTVALIAVCRIKGESPRWRSGAD
jgi:hypothetical protein